jgi:site-specific DNA recombinase
MDQLAHRLNKNKRRVWGYVRVSSQKQADNESIPAQESAIREYCKVKSLEEPDFVAEVASAAKPVFAINLPGTPKTESSLESSPRPKLLLLLGHLRLLKGAHFVLWKLDRLARIEYEQELFLDMLRRDKIGIHSVQAGEAHMLDGGFVNDPARVFSRQVLAAAAQYERALVEMRMKAGITYKAARGGYTGGPPIYGYKPYKKELIIVPENAKMIRYIFWLRRRYLLGHVAISEHINTTKREGAPRFPRQKIGRILANEEFYKGIYKDCFNQKHMRPDLRILPEDEEELDNEFAQPD